jgi:hypothetical protein
VTIDRTARGQFAEGNQVNTTHGGRSAIARKAVRERVRQEMRDLILTALPDPTPGDLLVVDLLVSAMADVRQLSDWIDGMGGPVTKDGKPYKAMELLTARESRAMQLMDRLGFGPRARAQIVASLGGQKVAGLATQLAAKRAELATVARNGGRQ